MDSFLWRIAVEGRLVLPYEEYEQLQEQLSDYEDLKDLRAAKTEEADAPEIALEDARRELQM